MLSNIRKLLVGDSGANAQETNHEDEPLEGEEEGERVQIPKVRIGMSTNRPTQQSVDTANTGSKVGDKDDDEIERMENTGTITALEHSTQVGVIDRQYKFDMTKFCSGNSTYERGIKVEFQAERSRRNPAWRVTSMKIYESSIEKLNKERSKFRKVKATVKLVDSQKIQVDPGKDKSSPRFITIPNKPEFAPEKDSLWMPGDCVEVHLKRLDTDDTDNDDDIPADVTTSVVLSMTPVQKKTLVGKITKRFNNFLIDDSIYFTEDICKYQFPIGTLVKCTAILSIQHIGSRDRNPPATVSWRALKVEKSQFLHYTAPDANGESENDWLMDEAGKEAAARYQDLMMDKCGIRINPRSIRCPPMLIGSSLKRTVTISNTTTNHVVLRKIKFNQDPSVCQFEIKQIGHDEIEEVEIVANKDVQFEIECKPLMVGRTTEMCVFEFGDFHIARNIIVIGQSEEEKRLVVEGAKDRPKFKKQVGEGDISKVIVDRERRRVRGNQSVRAPFFSQKRLPLFKVPIELYQILKEQDERELKRRFPNALELLSYENYKQKFHVSLWFEEIENDLRRRQYDMRNVVLTRFGHGTQTYFTFQALGIQDFQPPVNAQETIDAFDAENPNNAKYQGTIMKIHESEVTCTFGDAFNEQYTGFPLTIQFNLGRTNYKRCHYAVETASEFLGEQFLFPNETVIVKSPRIHIFEEGDHLEVAQESNDSSVNVGAQQHNGDSVSSIFRKARPTAGLNSSTSAHTPTTSDMMIGRRAPSVKSRFVSNTSSVPSCKEAKLEWFNTSLNKEQKDAVRRILRGQARPLPYIIFGPPGTGKTVTLVEAVMQVNKLDKNSRVLVCAPSNAAADVIAEYLANSNQYHPGDFIRLNGFLRAGQTLLETIIPFCTDGEDLNTVAMHRLIVSTCMTGGQFFNLDIACGHFTHVFIDEAGYCTEPETMVPTILLALNKGGQLILAGDPNQLGPVLMSDVAQNCQLNRSFLERLMLRKLYSRDPEKYPDEKYNPLVLTKLVKNYRAHPALLKLPSSLFYDDDLISEASLEEAFDLIDDPNVKTLLVNEGVPLIFHGVQGKCTRERDSPSWCNMPEAVIVVHYVAALMRKCGLKFDDIGIITPYRKQVEKIRLALQMNLLDDELPKVASVEEFQGGERKVIIISTVRSLNEDKIDGFLDRLSFIYQPKRFNVVITRAKALMIVVGNPHVLCRNPYWNKLLNYVIELKAYKGCNLPIALNQNTIERLGLNQTDKSAESKDKSVNEGQEEDGDGDYDEPDSAPVEIERFDNLEIRNNGRELEEDF